MLPRAMVPGTIPTALSQFSLPLKISLRQKQVSSLSIIAVEQGFSNLGDAYKLLPDYRKGLNY